MAQLDFVTATTTYEKAKVELDRATGTTLEHNGHQDSGCYQWKGERDEPVSRQNIEPQRAKRIRQEP